MRQLAMQAVLGLLVLVAALGADTAAAAGDPARSADDFVDSVGVNISLHAQGSVYDAAFESVIRPKLVASRIRHVRDGAATHAAAGPDFFYYRRCRALADAGIRFNLTTTFRTAHQEATDLGKLAGVRRWCGGAVESFEGVNEPDLQPMPAGVDWVRETVAFQQALYQTVRNDAALDGVRVLGPTVVWSPHAVGDLSAHLDYGNWHPYPGGFCPTCGDVYGQGLDFYLPQYRAPSGGKPMVTTETGYHNAVNVPYTSDIHRPVSERAAGRYVPRLLLEYFNRGFVRTYLFELIDRADDPTRGDRDANFGLLRHDGSEKPAYRAVKNLLGLLRDSGGPVQPGTLDFSLEGDLDRVHHTLLQKRNGSFYLALWQERPSYDNGARANAPDDVAARRDLVVPPQQVRLVLAKPPAAATLHRFADTGDLSSERLPIERGAVALAVDDRVTVVELPYGRNATGGDPAARERARNRPPRLSHVRLTRRVFAPAARRARGHGRRRGGSRLRFRLSERATVSVLVRRAPRRARVRRPVLGRIRARRRAGRGSLFISGRFGGRALRADRYVARVRARDGAGAHSPWRTVRFRIASAR